MRRSQAPSVRKIKSDEIKQNQSSVRSTSSVLEIFQNSTENIDNKEEIQQIPHTDTERTVLKENVNEIVSNNVTNDIVKKEKIFNVVWGKKSTRKHKKWEGDGSLLVGLRSAILKDEDGKIIGRISNVNTDGYVEGHILSMGDKEVQIIELASTNVIKEESVQQPAKKIKLHTKPTKKNTGTSQFLLPQPPLEHQWKNNDGKSVTEVYVDEFLTQTLRQHQKQGIAFLYECIMGYKSPGHYGAILADEMGLGKTLQCIALVWTLSKKGPYGGTPVVNKTLVVAPSGLLKNWIAELNRWLGRYRMFFFMVDSKNQPAKYIEECPKNQPSIMLISYDMFLRHSLQISDVKFDILICDEGHRLKNDSTKLTKQLNKLECKRRILVTGTPVQNDLLEFYTLSNFVNKGILGDLMEFRSYYVQPILASRNPTIEEDIKKIGKDRECELNRKIASFVLRRRANQLPSGILPTKNELVIFCAPSKDQVEYYIEAVDSWRNSDSENRPPHLAVLAQMQRICAHPFLSQNCDVKMLEVNKSGKLIVLMKLLQTFFLKRVRVVIVSSRTRILDLIENLCERNKYKSTRLDGGTPPSSRQTLVNRFNDGQDGCFVFLLSSRAGGVGLNLIGASKLILFDSDWNPATDLQAMARIWRDGQRKSVHIYRLLTAGTIEEKIFQRQIMKTDLSNAVVDPDKKSSFRLSDDELKDLLNTDQLNTIDCSTHLALDCNCSCDGSVPKCDWVDSEERRCQLGNSDLFKNDNTTFMNQLMRWEHHAPPFNEVFLKDCGLSECYVDITFIFRNVCLAS